MSLRITFITISATMRNAVVGFKWFMKTRIARFCGYATRRRWPNRSRYHLRRRSKNLQLMRTVLELRDASCYFVFFVNFVDRSYAAAKKLIHELHQLHE